MDNATLSQRFNARLRQMIIECRSLGYNPRDFEAMLDTSDGVEVAKRLVTSGIIQIGLKNIAELGRLDLTVESIMLESEFSPLFQKPYLDAAAWRLTQVQA